jgi:hypothetical protein
LIITLPWKSSGDPERQLKIRAFASLAWWNAFGSYAFSFVSGFLGQAVAGGEKSRRRTTDPERFALNLTAW